MWLKITDLEMRGYELTKQTQFSHMSSLKLSFRNVTTAEASKNVMVEDSTLSGFEDEGAKINVNHSSITWKMQISRFSP